MAQHNSGGLFTPFFYVGKDRLLNPGFKKKLLTSVGCPDLAGSQ